MQSALGTVAVALLLLLAGCLPYSCRREESTDLLPSDSLSRRVAASVPMDTLRPNWSAAGSLEYPRTLRFVGADRLYVSDAERNSIFVFSDRGTVVRELVSDSLAVPYIAGTKGDTLATFSPAAARIDLLVGRDVVKTVHVPDADRPETSLVYAAYDGRIFYKRLSPNASGFVAEVDVEGREGKRYPLDGPHWRHAGLLRMWGDSVLSLSGFRPVVDVVASGSIDTLALRGFDSPMLARSRSFILGEVHEPPLLSTSAAAEGNYLFVVNVRAGWLRVDVFDRKGTLRARLTEGNQHYTGSFFPQDIDVRRLADGRYEIAVALSQPAPEIRTYWWSGADLSRRAPSVSLR